jgi:hypothetical protein
MTIKTQPVRLSETITVQERLVKRCALGIFRLVRTVALHAEEVPGVVKQAASDIRDAWEETSRPKS